MREAPRYSLDRRKYVGRNRRLVNTEVLEIRRWATREGFGLPLGVQVDLVGEWYPTVGRSTLRDVLMNHSWYDRTYDHDTPQDVGIRLAQSPWQTIWLLVWRVVCGGGSSPGSKQASTLP